MKNRKKLSHRRSRRKAESFPPPRLPSSYPWKVIAALFSDLDSFINVEDSKVFSDILRRKDTEKLLDLAEAWGLQSINLGNWKTVAEIAAIYQLSALLKRFPFESNKLEREEAAKKKFFSAEESCRDFNLFRWKNLAIPSTPEKLEVFTYAQAFIAKVLGQTPDFDSVTKWSRHGPGATLSTSHGANSLYDKYSVWPYDVTKAAAVHARDLIQNDPRWLGALEDSYRDRFGIPKHSILNLEMFWTSVFHIVEGNRVTFVPKTARTERTIAIEPTMNLVLQLGVDGFIRKRLKRFHIDLDDQSKNQKFARLGSIDGSYATIDLSAASDTVSLKLCRILLPPQWYAYLIALRSPSGQLGKESISYEKISSMGNGYTFALESLIFGSIVYGVIRSLKGKVSPDTFCVYGDDIIVETDCVDLLISCLEDIGFTVNSDKTFCKGPVRESCGTDWFQGHLIRPVFIDEVPCNIKQLFSARNRLKRALELHWYILDSNTQKSYDSWVPEVLLSFIGPKSSTDFDSYRHMSFPYGIRYKHCLYKFKRIVYVPKSFPGPQFLFRKLMATLRIKDQFRFLNRSDLVQVAGLKGGGSSFTVTRRNRVIMSVVPSQASYWPEEYTADWL